MELPKYMLGTVPGENFEPVIIRTTPPLVVGHPFLVGKDNTEEVERMNLGAANGRIAKCMGHTVYIGPMGTLDDNAVPEEEMGSILKEMAAFFTETRLQKKPAMYRCNCENPKEIPSPEKREYYRQRNLRHRKGSDNF